MKRVKTLGVLCVVAAGGAAWGAAGPDVEFRLSPELARRIEFARNLVNRRWFDIAEEVVADLETADVAGFERALLHREIGDFYADGASSTTGGERGLLDYIAFLRKAREHYRKFLDHSWTQKRYEAYAQRPDSEGARDWLEEYDRVRARLPWISLSIAETYSRLIEEPQTTDEQKKNYKAQAERILRDAIGEFTKTIAERDRQVAQIEKKKPKRSEREAYQKWEERKRRVEAEYFRARLWINEARLRLARFLRKVGEKEEKWRQLLKEAENDLVELRKQFPATPGAKQAGLNLAIVMYEQGPKRDEDALERLTDLWQDRRGDTRFIPCEAAYWIAKLRMRQKNYKEAIKILHELLTFRSGGAWEPNALTDRAVEQYLLDNEGARPEEFDQKAIARALLLLAEAHGEHAAKGEREKMPPKDVRRFYGYAYEIASTVSKVRRRIDPDLIAKAEKWRKKAGRERTTWDLQQSVIQALGEASRTRDAELKKQKYLQAATSLALLLTRGELPPEEMRRNWLLVGQCYYFAQRYQEAYIVFTAYTRWFPTPRGEQIKAADFARAATRALRERTESDFADELHKRATAYAELVRVGGGSWENLRQAIERRREGKFEEAFELLDNIQPDNDAFPHALYHRGLTHKSVYQQMVKEAERRGEKPDEALKGDPRARKALLGMGRSFLRVLQVYPRRGAKLREAEDEDSAETLRRLLDVVAATLVELSSGQLSAYWEVATRTLDVTGELERDYPGIAKSPAAAAVYLVESLERDEPALRRSAYLIVLPVTEALAERYASLGAGPHLAVLSPAQEMPEELSKAHPRILESGCIGILCVPQAVLADYPGAEAGPEAAVLYLTDQLEERYPGIGGSPYAPLVHYFRMRAAFELRDAVPAEASARLASVLDGEWEALQKYPDFEYLAGACQLCAYHYLNVAKRLRSEAEEADQEARKQELLRQAKSAEDKALGYYLELLQRSPKQDLAIYHQVIVQLRERGSREDYDRIVELAPKAIELYADSERPKSRETVRFIRAVLGLAHATLGNYAQAAEVLGQADQAYEKLYEQRLAQYEADSARADKGESPVKPQKGELDPRLYEIRLQQYQKDLKNFRSGEGLKKPQRNLMHRDVRYWLARSYLEIGDKDHYERAAEILAERESRFRREDDAKAHLDSAYWLAEVLRRQGERGRALGLVVLAELNRPAAIRKDPFNTDYRKLLGRIKGDIEKMRESATRARMLDDAQELLEKLRQGTQ
ncbi:MAG: hypothetical protein ACOC8A_00960 [bacterium]